MPGTHPIAPEPTYTPGPPMSLTDRIALLQEIPRLKKLKPPERKRLAVYTMLADKDGRLEIADEEVEALVDVFEAVFSVL